MVIRLPSSATGADGVLADGAGEETAGAAEAKKDGKKAVTSSVMHVGRLVDEV